MKNKRQRMFIISVVIVTTFIYTMTTPPFLLIKGFFPVYFIQGLYVCIIGFLVTYLLERLKNLIK